MERAAHAVDGTVKTIDPATGAHLAAYEESSEEQIDATLDRAVRAAASWRSLGSWVAPITTTGQGARRSGKAGADRHREAARVGFGGEWSGTEACG